MSKTQDRSSNTFSKYLDEVDRILNWLSPGSAAHRKHKAKLELKNLITTTVALNRMELAKDIKRRHWVNDALRDSYLKAVIEVAEEELAQLKPNTTKDNER